MERRTAAWRLTPQCPAIPALPAIVGALALLAVPPPCRAAGRSAPARKAARLPVRKAVPATAPHKAAVTPPGLTANPRLPVKGFSGQCVGLLDGATLLVSDDAYEQVKVRLYGIAAPDLAQEYGREAYRDAQALAFLKRIMLYVKGKDSDGALLVWAFIATNQGQLCLNRELVRRGDAWWNRPHAPGEMMLGIAEAEAKGDKRGLWSLHAPIPPWEFHAQHRKQ